MISLTIARNPDGSEKHTLKNVRETGEFCFNVVTHPVWKEMVDSANAFPEGDSEFAETGLTPIPSVKIEAPRVKEVPIHFECKLHQVIELGPNRHPLVIGEVVYMHVDPALHDRRLYRYEEARSDGPAQRLFLCDARRDFRAEVRRRAARYSGGRFLRRVKLSDRMAGRVSRTRFRIPPAMTSAISSNGVSNRLSFFRSVLRWRGVSIWHVVCHGKKPFREALCDGNVPASGNVPSRMDCIAVPQRRRATRQINPS